MGHFCPFPPRRIKRVTIPTILLSKHLRRSRLPLDYTYTSLKILKLSRATRPSLKTVWNDRVCAGCYTLFNAKPRRGGGREGEDVSISKKKRKKEGNKNKAQSTFFLSPPDFSARLSILREKPYSFDHPILPFPYYHIGHGTGRNKIPHGRERKNRVERERERPTPPFPFFISDVLTHRGNKKESRDRKTSISKHTVGTVMNIGELEIG